MDLEKHFYHVLITIERANHDSHYHIHYLQMIQGQRTISQKLCDPI